MIVYWIGGALQERGDVEQMNRFDGVNMDPGVLRFKWFHDLTAGTSTPPSGEGRQLVGVKKGDSTEWNRGVYIQVYAGGNLFTVWEGYVDGDALKPDASLPPIQIVVYDYGLAGQTFKGKLCGIYIHESVNQAFKNLTNVASVANSTEFYTGAFTSSAGGTWTVNIEAENGFVKSVECLSSAYTGLTSEVLPRN